MELARIFHADSAAACESLMDTALGSHCSSGSMKHTAVVAIHRLPCLHQAAQRLATNHYEICGLKPREATLYSSPFTLYSSLFTFTMTRLWTWTLTVVLMGCFFFWGLQATLMGASQQEASVTTEFAEAAQLAASGETEKAIALYQALVRAHPFSQKAEEAQFQIARLLQQEGRDTASFKAYTNLLKKYPETPHFEEAVAQQITIANAYLRGKRVKLCGIPAFSVVERAQEMYENILMLAPYSKYAALTQFNLGLSMERQGKSMEAIAAYQKLIDKYPTSSICDNALYQIGYVYMSLGMAGKSQDLSALKEAQHSFDDYLIQYPNSDKSQQASDNIAAMQHREALDTLRIAHFYDFSKNYRASSIYYNEVLRQFPQSKDAAIAKARLAEIKNEVGEEALRPSATPLSGTQTAANRRLQAQVETTALSNYDGPPKKEIAPNDPTQSLPEMKTNVKEVTGGKE